MNAVTEIDGVSLDRIVELMKATDLIVKADIAVRGLNGLYGTYVPDKEIEEGEEITHIPQRVYIPESTCTIDAHELLNIPTINYFLEFGRTHTGSELDNVLTRLLTLDEKISRGYDSTRGSRNVPDIDKLIHAQKYLTCLYAAIEGINDSLPGMNDGKPLDIPPQELLIINKGKVLDDKGIAYLLNLKTENVFILRTQADLLNRSPEISSEYRLRTCHIQPVEKIQPLAWNPP